MNQSSTTTTASSASVTFDTAAQTVVLSAAVTSATGPVNEGTETFTILNGGNPIGSAVSATVSSGSVTASYMLPAGTAIGTYTIEAVYNETADYGTSSDTSQSLTIKAPATIMWNTTTAPTGGDWDTPGNWLGGAVPTAASNVVINLTSSGTVTHSTGANDAALSLTTNGNTALSIGSGSINLGAGSSSLASVTIGSGASLNMAAGASVLIQGGQTITDNGAMNITGASIGFVAGFEATTQILVNGTLSASASNFYISGSNYASFALLQVDSGGQLTASTTTFNLNELSLVSGSILNSGDLTNDTFNLPIYVPFQDVALLSNNDSFQNINIITGTMASGQTLSLVPIGTVSTASLVYIFQGNFTVGTGATLTIGTGTSVLIDPVTITDNGAMNITGASIGFVAGFEATTQILVNGTLSASASNFYISGSNYASFALLQVDSGGDLTASTTTFNINELSLVSGSILNSGDLTNDTFNLPIYVPFQDVALLSNNDSFQNINIITGTMASGQTLSLVPIGTVSTASLVYIFQGNFTVGTGATLTIGTGTSVLIDPVTITDNGAMNITDASIGFVAGFEATTQILVNGTLSASASNFYISGSNYASFALLQVDSGGQLTASTTTFNINELSLVSGSILNSGDLTNDTFNLPIYVPFQDVALLSNNDSFQNINIITGTMASGQTLSLVPIGTVSTASLVYIFQGNFTVGTGATLTVGTGTSVLIDPVTITDNGAMNITGASIGFVAGFEATTQILVNGTLSASASNFYISGSNYASFALLQVDSGGQLTASTTTFNINELSLVSGSILNSGDLTNDTFNLPIYVPFQDVALLSNNDSFQNINIITGTMASGQTLSLVPIGTVSTASLVYIFQGNFTVGTGATLTVGTGTSVLIDPVTITDNGAMNITGASIGFVAGFEATTQILVNGTLSASASNFYISGSNYASFALLQVDSGGDLTASTTTFNINELSLVSGSILNSGDLTNDTFNLPIYVPFQDVALLSNNDSFQNINIITGTMASGQTLSLVPIGTVSTASLVYIFQGNFTVGTGATLTIGTGTSVLIDPVTITDNGAMNITDASIGFVAGFEATTQILVNGTLSASASNFYISGSNYASFALLQVDSGGELTASTTTFNINELSLVSGSILNSGDLTNDTFNLPIYVPFQDVALLSNNDSFQNINIITGTMASGQTLSLVPIGTVSTASLVYIFQGNFTVGTGATLTVGTGTSVLIDPVTITDNGAMNITGASIGFVAGFEATTQILVNGTLSASASNFYISGSNYASFALLQVDSGGELTATSSTFSVNELAVASGSTANLQFVTFASQLAINSGASNNIHNDDLSSASATVVASGGSTTTIDLTNNFWGTLNTTQIAAKITDHTNNSSLPTVLYQPFLTEDATGTFASNSAAPFSTSPQSVALSATVISASGVVNAGTATFSILNGSAVVGMPVVSNVVNGIATAEYALPAGAPGGVYTIQVVFSGTSSLLGSSDTSHTLTITAPAYPDLQVQGLAVSPTTILSGNTVDVTWNDANTGNAAVNGAFVDSVTVVNTTTSATLLETNVTYDPTLPGNSPIAPGGSVPETYSFTLPQGLAGTGSLSFTVTTDADNQIIESNPSGTGETNNTATLTVTSILATYSVNSIADSGAGSLRDAIDYIDAHGGGTTIDFDFGTGPQTIDLLSPLPAITVPLTIDGTTEPGYSSTPLIELDGSGAGAGANGLTLAGNGIIVKGLIIGGFGGDGIEVTGNNDLVESSYIGIDSTGNHAMGNGKAGVAIIDGAMGNTIGGTTAGSGNVISANAATEWMTSMPTPT